MHDKQRSRATLGAGLWVLSLLCVAVVLFTLASGAAYTGIQQARLTAAKASLGHIESVFRLAQLQAEAQGIAPPDGSYSDLLKSYDPAQAATLPEYEKFILNSMLDTFGPARDFDFAVERYQEGDGMRTTIYYFPVKGRTDMKKDLHYILSNGKIVS